MAKNIFVVNAQIVDANGSFTFLSGYPKIFNSASYEGNVDKALKRAEGEFSECWGAMCKRDDRQIQVVTLTDVYGNQIDKKRMGDFPVEAE
jgi:hypothetical protein